MIFGPEMLPKVLSGEKTVTRRRTSHYVTGQTYAVQPGRGKRHVAHVRVLSANEERLWAISHRDAPREGFENPAAFMDYWTALHGSWNPDEIVTRIEFELVASCPRCREATS